MLRGEDGRAQDYLDLDRDSDVSQAVSMDVLLHEAKVEEAIRRAEANLPGWGAYDVLLASLKHRPPAEIAALARHAKPANDPEMNFFAAGHLAYAGQVDAALSMLKRAIDGGYCSFPAIDTDPFFEVLRARRKLGPLRLAAQECQNEFLRERQ